MTDKMKKRLPVLFIGHGSPMNAIENNAFTKRLGELGSEVPRPKAILCISAHWMTEGTWVTHMSKPKTIHDFYGFPQSLFDIQYPAPGSPEFAGLIRDEIKDSEIGFDDQTWGLDHGAWSILRHMYPKADIPVIQLSLDMRRPEQYHFRMGKRLRALRDQGVLILGSGNIVHNLGKIDFNPAARPFDWAIEFDQWVKGRLLQRDYETLVKSATGSLAGQLSIPTPEHWYPMFYTLGSSDHQDQLRFEYESIDHASISMRCFSLGLGNGSDAI